jgi:Ca-activated chloride channel family protein
LSFFAQPELLFLIPIITGILGFVFFKSQQSADKKLRLLVASKFIEDLVPLSSKKRKFLKFLIFIIGFSFLILALAEPQWGESQRTISPKSIDILIAVDLSHSMLARDVKPNRLERVKLTLNNLISNVQGNRLGLIGFSGNAFVQCPLTLDHLAFTKSINDLEVGLIPVPGTDLAKPIEVARRTFSKDDTDKFLILISDGEDLEGQGLLKAKEVAKDGIKVFTIGIGSEEGSNIKTQSGKNTVSKFDEDSLRKISIHTGGQYTPLGPKGEGLDYVFSELRTLGQRKSREQSSTSLPIKRYQIFVFLGLIFLITEILTSTARKKISSASLSLFLFLLFFSPGCWKTENIKLAEEAVENEDPLKAAEHYLKEAENIEDRESRDLGKLYLNAGLAYLDAGQLEEAEKYLQLSLNTLTDFPALQSKALSALGNLHYTKTNSYLDKQDVKRARSSWENAKEFYSSSLSINGNSIAKENLQYLNQQITDKIEAFVSKIQGVVWRDINGNGQQDSNEPLLSANVFWDRNSDGDLNDSLEPFVETNSKGQFAFEWISGIYPTSLNIGSELVTEGNRSSDLTLLPLFQPPPPPLNPNQVKNHFLKMDKPSTYSMMIPWRAAPIIRGKVWNDQNRNSFQDQNESGSSTVTIFLDANGNSQLDQNETSFKPSKDGSFSHISSPGQYTVCIQPDNPEANITLPFEKPHVYLTWIDFEKSAAPLLFGIYEQSPDSNSSDQQNQQSEMNDETEPQENNSSSEDSNFQETNALYERLLQETESKSKLLPLEVQRYDPTLTGRDY